MGIANANWKPAARAEAAVATSNASLPDVRSVPEA
jgi:hypothetical protein